MSSLPGPTHVLRSLLLIPIPLSTRTIVIDPLLPRVCTPKSAFNVRIPTLPVPMTKGPLPLPVILKQVLFLREITCAPPPQAPLHITSELEPTQIPALLVKTTLVPRLPDMDTAILAPVLLVGCPIFVQQVLSFIVNTT